MRVVVLDTDVVISAGIQEQSSPAILLMDWVLEGLVQIVTCPSIATEYREVARRAKFRRYGFPPLWLEFLIRESLQLPEPLSWPHPLPDPEDAPFLALAHLTGAWLVTGNLRHFPSAVRAGVHILSPSEYLEHLQSSNK